MRVLHVDTAREWRGGQTQLLHLATRQPGDAAVVLPPDAPIRPTLEEAGVPTFGVGFGGRLTGTHALARAIDDFAPDVVAAHTSHAHAHAVRVSDAPVVVHRRNDFRPSAFSKRMYRSATGFVAVSHAVRGVLLRYGIDDERIAVVYDGVDPTPFDAASGDRPALLGELGLDGDVRLVLAVGALVEHKGHVYLVDAMSRLDASVHCLIAGEGPRRDDLLRMAAARGVGDRLHLLGQRTDVPALLHSVDLFCHPSVEEGLGQVVIEALLAGCGVVATTAGGVPEVAEGWGIVVPPRDPAELARAIEYGLAHPAEMADAVATAQGALRTEFSVDAMVDGTMAAYRRFRQAAAMW